MENLCIRKGTLTSAERDVINYHIVATIKMLEKLPWPKHLKHVPEFAGGHHERMDGRGYPKGLTREQMSVQARIMGIADIFEALTASDRPYKPGMKLSQAMRIMNEFKRNGHIDPDLFDVFVNSEVYRRYGERFLNPLQLDEVRLSDG
jgi:HD-GYP domain-containing protein (c-di-GMP phosphodiesterase class II)